MSKVRRYAGKKANSHGQKSRLYARLKGVRKIGIRRQQPKVGKRHLRSEVKKRPEPLGEGQLTAANSEGAAAANHSRGRGCMVGRTIGTRRENENTNFPVMESAVTKKNGNVISGMEEWYQLQTPPAVVRALSELGFRTPTEIQRRAIPPAIEEQCNVIGAAETGSGKTLAFAIPILHYILHNCKCETTPAMTTPLSQEKGCKEEIIDLNQVVYLTKEGVELGVEFGAEDREEGPRDAGYKSSEDDSSPDISGEHPSSNSEASSPSDLDGSREGPNRRRGLGLVTYRDNIPDEEFERMLRSGGSHDHTIGPNTESHDAPDTVNAKSLGGYCGTLVALILTPTRELALQVHSHIKAAAKYTGIKVCVVVGGMAIEKQERLLRQLPPIVVATPGRLWKLMNEGDSHLRSLDHLKFLVLDEADRMVEYGHYQELGRIIDRVNGTGGAASRQTLVFSATLTLPRRSTERKKKKRGMSREESLDTLMTRVGLSEGEGGKMRRVGGVKVVDLTQARGTVATLTETKITCSNQEKDAYLYYFLLMYPGRTLVFVNSIDCLQRVRSLLLLLRLQPLPLHAHLQQKQRIKNLERFASNPTGLLLASDVAARGLDIPSVQHVIHYQVPRNSELYVHRSGRTARAQAEGLSVIIVGPDEVRAYRNICKTLNRDELSTFPINPTYLKPIRVRVGLARRIDSREHKRRKSKKSNDWLIQSAKAMDIELDEDMLMKDSGGSDQARVQSMKAELDLLLRTPILPRSVSMTFPTRDENHAILARVREASTTAADKTQRVVTAEDKAALAVARQKLARKHYHRV